MSRPQPQSNDNFRKIFVAGVVAVFIGYGAFVILAPGAAEVALERVETATVAVEKYRDDTGELPKDLDVLVSEGYLETRHDSLGFGLMYKKFGDRFEVYSVGIDGAPATRDDVTLRGRR
jgi:hypothetical protein